MIYLFTLTIAEVQKFIFQSQKTKDLFNSSEIIANLMKKTIETLKEYDDLEIILPKSKDFVSNKVVAVIETSNIKDIGEKLESNIHNEFIKEIFKNTCKYKKNLKEFFQVFWVAVELKDDYKKSYKKLEQSLSVIKNIRRFKQLNENERKDKCILCGERVQEEDKLCLVCLAKRKCEIEKQDYPSTAKIALLDWLEGLDYDRLKSLKDENGESFDEQWFFEYDKKSKEIKEQFEKWLKDNEDILKNRKKKKSYALLKFDIDDLGKKLSSLDKDKQKELSLKLGEFAQKTKELVDNYGKTIYAGGDDFLGFVNLEYLFKVIDDIYCDFKNMGFDEIVENLTFSTSIIVAHYKTPLHKVLDYSRELLEETKSHFDDKNGVGMIVMNSNAINAKSIFKYQDFNLLKDMVDKNIGMRLNYKLKKIFYYIDNIDYEEFLTQKEMIKIEIKRLLKREEGSFDDDIYKKLCLFLDKQSIKIYTNTYLIDFDNFIGFLKSVEQIKKVLK